MSINWKQIRIKSVAVVMSLALCNTASAQEKTAVADKAAAKPATKVEAKVEVETKAKSSAKVDAKTATAEKAGEDSSAKETTKKKVKPQVIKLADGKLLLPVPGEWKVKKPRNRIVKHEYSVAPVKGDKTAGRLTVMPAGGSVEANIIRWAGQFRSSDGKALGDEGKKVESKKIGDLTVHVVDLTGTFMDAPRGPFGPKVNRPGYRMLALILPTKKNGTWFVKFYGPEATIKASEKVFAKMVEGIEYTP